MDQRPSTASNRVKPTLVVGLGNPLLGDDSVGWQVAEQVRQAVCAAKYRIEVDCLAVGGLRLMERLVGYDRAILIDAITTGRDSAGSLSCCALEDLPDWTEGHFSSAHDVTLQIALDFGRALGLRLPGKVIVVGVEAEGSFDFAEVLSPSVSAAVPRAVQTVLDLLRWLSVEEQRDDFP